MTTFLFTFLVCPSRRHPQAATPTPSCAHGQPTHGQPHLYAPMDNVYTTADLSASLPRFGPSQHTPTRAGRPHPWPRPFPPTDPAAPVPGPPRPRPLSPTAVIANGRRHPRRPSPTSESAQGPSHPRPRPCPGQRRPRPRSHPHPHPHPVEVVGRCVVAPGRPHSRPHIPIPGPGRPHPRPSLPAAEPTHGLGRPRICPRPRPRPGRRCPRSSPPTAPKPPAA